MVAQILCDYCGEAGYGLTVFSAEKKWQHQNLNYSDTWVPCAAGHVLAILDEGDKQVATIS